MVTWYDDLVNCILFCGSKMTGCSHPCLFSGGASDSSDVEGIKTGCSVLTYIIHIVANSEIQTTIPAIALICNEKEYSCEVYTNYLIYV